MNLPAREGRSDRIKIARESYIWLNAHRCAASDDVAQMCVDIAQMIENYEVSDFAPAKLRRKRRRRDSEKKPDKTNFRLLVEAVLCDLAHHHAIDPGGWLVVSRDRGQLSSRSRYKPAYLGKALPHLLDILAQPEIGFIEQRLGQHVRGTDFGTTTMIRPTQKLIDRYEQHDADMYSTKLRPGEEVIVLRGNFGDDDRNPRAWLQYEDDEQTNKLRADLRRINDYLERALDVFDIDVDDVNLPPGIDPTAVRMRRFFTFRSFEKGGRLYRGFWQGLPRRTRQDVLTLQGEPVITLDFSQAALRIAYGLAGADLPPGDGYSIDGLEGNRTGVKKLVNSMFFPRDPNWKTKIPFSIVKKLPNIAERDILSAIRDRHPALAEHWWTDIGHRIQRVESDIIVDCLLQCVERDIVALQVHDALIIPRSAEADVKEIMLESFERIAGVPAEVDWD
ncbi:MAG: hypothetical protein QNJ14_00955 [Woeseiaceae bacterium]|nr:hypothetical protein [Woeseiaceae bacterium]